ncbi:MAG TPA: hypothetical protein DCE41_37860 [Cytophagales bacterium]|nr:hypothetical protein [Cytophagales bacterium]HAA18707.1 hypothetical protein [Cytophagales bacterium]HAP61562.1 hypothetical protein [Cytophagales bacterium]
MKRGFSSLLSICLVIASFLLSPISSEGQQIDSLKAKIPELNNDSVGLLKVKLELADIYIRDSLPNYGLWIQESLDLSTAIGDSTSTGLAYLILGKGLFLNNREDSALSVWQIAYDWFAQSGYAPGIAEAELWIATYYTQAGNEVEALPHAQVAHRLSVQQRNKPSIAKSLNLLCQIYQSLGKYEEAVMYCGVAIALAEDLRLEVEKAEAYTSMGRIFAELEDPERAKLYIQDPDALDEQMGLARVKGKSYLELGHLAVVEGKLEQAIVYFQAAIQASDLANDDLGLAKAHNSLGEIYLKRTEYREARVQFLLAFTFARNVNDADELARAKVKLGFAKGNLNNVGEGRADVLDALALSEAATSSTQMDVYLTLGDFFRMINRKDSAIYFYRLRLELQEDVFRTEINENLGDQLKHYLEQEQDRQEQIQEENRKVAEQKDFNNRVKIYALVAGILAIGLIAAVLYTRYTVKNRATEALERQTESINRQKEEILAQRNEIVRKNRRLEEQTHQITNSIQYARDIQMAMLPEESELRAFFPESFIFNAPREIVSGDIFWFGRLGHRMVLAMIDCTGHGVPGAFLTVLVNNLLNQLVLEQQMHNPAEIITQLDEKVRKTLRVEEGGNDQSNTLDIALMVVDAETRWLEFTGAKMPLYYVHNYSLVQIKGDRFSVGSTETEEKFFTRQRIKLQEGDYIYMATDGFQNQFGGKEGKKFMKTQFRRLLNSLSTLPMASQRSVLEQRFQSWKGEQPQTDDVLVVGLQL